MTVTGDVITRLLKDISVTNVSTSSTLLIPANPNRRYLLIQNTGSENVGIAPQGTTAVIGGAGTIVLPQYWSYCSESNFDPTNGFNIIAATGMSNVVVIWEA